MVGQQRDGARDGLVQPGDLGDEVRAAGHGVPRPAEVLPDIAEVVGQRVERVEQLVDALPVHHASWAASSAA
ncbi:hypothetical protein ET495_08315 [Xylanimonas allomyrinae]|uniref:Uncharacterized protein n=1 Tax=Xylanimonas allomyrinae TaxID=2509459 RepID=A0A4P6EYV8_9MICO|nr:hypothetical protein ET495_08315 [Xylanimonas allomyrinae]